VFVNGAIQDEETIFFVVVDVVRGLDFGIDLGGAPSHEKETEAAISCS